MKIDKYMAVVASVLALLGCDGNVALDTGANAGQHAKQQAQVANVSSAGVAKLETTDSADNADVGDAAAKLGAWVEASSFASDARDRDRDGFAGLLPILSNAPKTCSPASALIKSGPDCAKVRATDYNHTGDNTWIDAQVFIPKHREGQKLPVILHSHGWGGSKLSKLKAIPKCNQADEPYHCPLGGKPSLIGGMFSDIESMITDLVNHGYVVVSFSERGFGKSEGDVMVMNAYHETEDAIAVLDWIAAQGKAGNIPVAVDEHNNFKVGLLGGSYGGGFGLMLAARDKRVDTIVPFGTWHSLVQSIVPNHATKGGWGNLLCLAAMVSRKHAYLQESCTKMSMSFVRDEKALDPKHEVMPFLNQNGLNYFAELERNQQAFKEGEAPYQLPKIDALLVQGMSDVLFPMEEAVNNFNYLKKAGGDVRLLSREDGHLNPLANQIAGGPNCGNIDVYVAARKWFDVKLRGADSKILDSIPQVCIALDQTHGIHFDNLNQNAADAKNAHFKVAVGNTRGAQQCQTIYTATGDEVLAGRAQLHHLKVSNDMLIGRGVAYLGLCLKRDGKTKLIDEQLTAYALGSYSTSDFLTVGERLQKGDEIGVAAYKDHIQMFTFGPTMLSEFSTLLFQGFKPQEGQLQQSRIDANRAAETLFSSNAYTAEGDISLPIIFNAKVHSK